jgi:hypothetical protein
MYCFSLYTVHSICHANCLGFKIAQVLRLNTAVCVMNCIVCKLSCSEATIGSDADLTCISVPVNTKFASSLPQHNRRTILIIKTTAIF